VAIVHDVGAELLYSLEQRFKLGIALFEVVDQRLDIIDFVPRFVEIAMPQ
jgi:hypothetical protein